MNVEITLWAVHIYKTPAAPAEGKGQPARYLRTVDATFTEQSAVAFCKSFNACGSCGRPSVVAIAKKHTVHLHVEGSCHKVQCVP